MFEDQFDKDTIARNFNFYEPLTVHESSLSASIHCILANSIGNYSLAYEMYLRTARLDLDDYNSDTKDGLHITSMGGTWMAIVEGFAGLRVQDGKLRLNPSLPESWQSYSFRIIYKDALLKITVTAAGAIIENTSSHEVELFIGENKVVVTPESIIEHNQHWQNTTE
jgi:maltose phosphorylase